MSEPRPGVGAPAAKPGGHPIVLGQQLLRARLVCTRRDVNRIYYILTDDRVAELWAMLRSVAASRVAEIEQLTADYLGDRDQLQTNTRAELRRRLRHRDVVVLDVRPATEYRAGHINGAISIPIDELLAGCRTCHPMSTSSPTAGGPYCAYEAVRALTRRGRRAARLEDGYPEWAAPGSRHQPPELSTGHGGRPSLDMSRSVREF